MLKFLEKLLCYDIVGIIMNGYFSSMHPFIMGKQFQTDHEHFTCLVTCPLSSVLFPYSGRDGLYNRLARACVFLNVTITTSTHYSLSTILTFFSFPAS